MLKNRPSFEQIDYTIRPAKSIERKMIGEMLAHLRVFRPVSDYVYVGLGSTFFTDFVLYHKLFGICEMLSIEKETTRQHRVDFNIPFSCVKTEYGKTTDVLPRLNWDKPAIVWLDYDGKIDAGTQDDITFLARNLVSSSVLIVTTRAENNDFPAGNPPNLELRLALIRKALDERVPDDLKPRHLSNLGEVIYRLTNSAIKQTLSEANAARQDSTRIGASQIMHFRYADGVKMITLGWIFLNHEDTRRYHRSHLSTLPFFKSGSNAFRIQPPKLTFKERKHLDSQLPGALADCPDVPRSDIAEYARLYRYYPWFTESEI